MRSSKTKAPKRRSEPPAHLDWTELCSIYSRARAAEDHPGELSEFTRLGYLAKDLRS